MNGIVTMGSSEEHHINHQQQQHSQNETSSDHPRSPASPLSIRHGDYYIYNIMHLLHIDESWNIVVSRSNRKIASTKICQLDIRTRSILLLQLIRKGASRSTAAAEPLKRRVNLKITWSLYIYRESSRGCKVPRNQITWSKCQAASLARHVQPVKSSTPLRSRADLFYLSLSLVRVYRARSAL